MVARTKPVTVTVARRIQKSSGVRLMFFHDRRTNTAISAHHGFANVHTVSAFVLCWDTCSSFDLAAMLVTAVAAPFASGHSSAVGAVDGLDFRSHSRQYSTRENEQGHGVRAYFGCVEFLNEVQSMFCAILVFRDRASKFLEEEVEVGRCAAINFLAEGEDDDTVKETHNAVAWLMYR